MYNNEYNRNIADMVKAMEKRYIANDILHNGIPFIGGSGNSGHNTTEELAELNKIEGLKGGAYGGVGGCGQGTFRDYGFEPRWGAEAPWGEAAKVHDEDQEYDMRGKLNGEGKKRGRKKKGMGISGGGPIEKAEAARILGSGESGGLLAAAATANAVHEHLKVPPKAPVKLFRQGESGKGTSGGKLKAMGAGMAGGKKMSKKGMGMSGGLLDILGKGMSGGMKEKLAKGLSGGILDMYDKIDPELKSKFIKKAKSFMKKKVKDGHDMEGAGFWDDFKTGFDSVFNVAKPIIKTGAELAPLLGVGKKKKGRPSKKGAALTQYQVGYGVSGGNLFDDIAGSLSNVADTLLPLASLGMGKKKKGRPAKEKKMKGGAVATIERSNLPSSSMAGGAKKGEWMALVKETAKKYNLSYKDAMKKAKELRQQSA